MDASALASAPIQHKWNDKDVPTFYTETDRIQSMIARTTTAGAVALAVGCLEWVAWRMSKHSDVTLLFKAIEAMWAGIIDYRYVRSLYDSPLVLKQKEWQGPAKGPVYAAYWQLVRLQERLEDRGPASPDASCAVRLARFVLPAPKPFEAWWRVILKRLVELHPDSEEGEDDIGKPIPREAMDPNLDYKLRDEKRYLAAFLKSLDPKTNPFLATPKEMKKAGFEPELLKI